MTNQFTEIYYKTMDEIRDFSVKLHDNQLEFQNSIQKELDELTKAIQKYKRTGKYDSKYFGELKTDDLEHEGKVEKKGRKPRKPALSELSENDDINIKKEKISDTDSSSSSNVTSTSTISIKENILIKTENDMPAPSWIPPKKKAIKTERVSRSVRTTRTKGLKAIEESSSDRSSDVIIQIASVPTVDLSDTEESESEKTENEEPAPRSTRTRQKENDRTTREPSSDIESVTRTTRTTRTKTLNKVKIEPAVEDEREDVPEEPQSRSTRTKTKAMAESSRDKKPDKTVDETFTRSTRTKTKKKKDEEQQEVENGVQSDTESVKSSKSRKEDHSREPSPKAVDSKSSKDATKSKRVRSNSTDEDDPKSEMKKSKADSPVQERDVHNTTGQTEYEDARSTIGPQTVNDNTGHLNSTFVMDKKPERPVDLNLTHVMNPVVPSTAPNATVILDKLPALSEDESIEAKTPPPKKQIKSKATKEVFSPYEKTSTKKKVEAFEKLQQDSTVTKGTLINKARNTPVTLKKSKYVTPVESKIGYPSSSSTSKISRLLVNQGVTPNESLNSLMNTQKEYREKKKEREQAMKKKEAMLQMQAEAKKKLNDEKQMRAMQQRKILEAEKLKQLEIQKLKEERLKQREQEREELLQQQKIETEKKRLAQKKKYQEVQQQRQQRKEKMKEAVYMSTKLPLLPTNDCYDSDDPEYERKTPAPPTWATGDRIRIQQYVMMTAGEKIKNTLFCRHAQTPDLAEIFENIDPRKLRRNSSMIWRQPPRYTMMPNLDETTFSDDDDMI